MMRKCLSTFKPRLEILEDRCTPSAGMLDPTFGSGGAVATALPAPKGGFTDSFVHRILVQPDGKIIAAGEVIVNATSLSWYSQLGLARYNSDGTLDTTFGSGGMVVLGKSGEHHNIVGAALQPDGNIDVVDGATFPWAVLQFKPNGTLDGSFGKGGTATISFGYNSGYGATDLIVQPPAPGSSEGKIIVSGSLENGGVCGLARLNPGGKTLDSSFGSGGTEITTIAGSLALQSTGKIIVGGDARFNSDGSLDTTFGSGGYASGGGATAVQSDDKIVVIGTGSVASQVVRYTSNGTMDTSFGNGGSAASPWGNTSYIYASGGRTAIAIAGDGNIIVAGYVTGAIEIGRYLGSTTIINGTSYPAGSLDPTFGTNGVVTQSVNEIGTLGKGLSAAIQSDGKILVGGATNVVHGEFALYRFLPSEPEIASFTASPNPVTAGMSTTLTASNITDVNPNATITQVAFYYIDGSDNQQLLGYGAQSSGVWSFNFTVNLASGNYTILAQAEDNYGVFGDAAAITLTVQ